MTLRPRPDYLLDFPALNAAVAGASFDPKHKDLLKRVQGCEGFGPAKLVAVTGVDQEMHLVKHRLYEQSGALVHEDLERLLADQLHALNGDATETMKTLAARKLIVARTYIVHVNLALASDSAEPDAYLQIRIDLHREVKHHVLFSEGWYGRVRDLDDLMDAAKGYTEEGAKDGPALSAPVYQLPQVVDVQKLIAQCAEIENALRLNASKRVFITTEVPSGKTLTQTIADLVPDFDKYPCKERRLFNDWRDSSAGQSGARLSDHWLLKVSDSFGRDAGTRRYLTCTPESAYTKKLAKIRTKGLDTVALWEKLLRLDTRMGVPFAWYFFMLHGNWVTATAGEMIIEGAEAGFIPLPERDYQVLKRWQRASYGF